MSRHHLESYLCCRRLHGAITTPLLRQPAVQTSSALNGETGSNRVFRYSSFDGIFIGLAFLFGCVLAIAPSYPLIAIGVWWLSNTAAHYFIHLPFFREPKWNRSFALYLSVVLGIPQRLWRDRHLAHHANRDWRLEYSKELLIESILIFVFWTILWLHSPSFFLTTYIPGYCTALCLCWIQGHYEHAQGTISHYGFLYNWLFFNDGYHVEHHLHPCRHWTHLSRTRVPDTVRSRWPAVLRWMDAVSLNTLEHLILKSRCLQFLVLKCHEQAFRKLLPLVPKIQNITIIGGGLFPRTALICQRLFPGARISIIDSNPAHLEIARRYLSKEVTLRHAFYKPRPYEAGAADLLIVPLAFIGNSREFYRMPQARITLVHDWLWRKHSPSATISWLLLKRLNLILGSS